ncbi:MAG: hypothetical protein JXR26_09715 [Balneolaceae bacterium]|nr:hypothetical protein [Balneolaceae bacterium]
MRKQINTYQFLTTWLLAAVFANLLVPAVMEATQLFCQDAPLVHTTEMHASSSCWMNTGSDATQTDLSHDNCSLAQICEQGVKTGLSETPVTQHQNIQVIGIPITDSGFYSAFTKSGKVTLAFSPENILPGREIYLLNSTFLN